MAEMRPDQLLDLGIDQYLRQEHAHHSYGIVGMGMWRA